MVLTIPGGFAEMEPKTIIKRIIRLYTDVFWRVSIFTQPLHSGRIWHKVYFQAEFNRFESSFLSPRLVASPRLKNPVCPTIYP